MWLKAEIHVTIYNVKGLWVKDFRELIHIKMQEDLLLPPQLFWYKTVFLFLSLWYETFLDTLWLTYETKTHDHSNSF